MRRRNRPKTLPQPTTADINRFFGFVSVDEDTGCWNWTGYKNAKGYGQFGFHGKVVWAHRFAYRAFKTRLPGDRQVHHAEHCLNPSCVNPDHLEILTIADNVAERNTRVGFLGNQHTGSLVESTL